jgi:hypothetical protein
MVPAIAAESGREHLLIDPNGAHKHLCCRRRLRILAGTHRFSSSPLAAIAAPSSFTRLSNLVVTTPEEAITTYAVSDFNSTRISASRRRRFALFRATAPPTRRDATIPTWGRPLSPSTPITLIVPARADRPVRKTVEKCAVDRSETNGRPVLRGETMAALETPSLDDGATGTGPHTRAESVLALATSHVGLIGTLHGEVSPLGRSRRDREDFGRLNPTSLPGLSVSSNTEREDAHRNAKSRPCPRNIAGSLPGRYPALSETFPVIPIPCSPYVPRLSTVDRCPSSPATGGFPLLAGPFVRDIYSQPIHVEGRTSPEGFPDRDGTLGAGQDDLTGFPHPVGRCVDRL